MVQPERSEAAAAGVTNCPEAYQLNLVKLVGQAAVVLITPVQRVLLLAVKAMLVQQVTLAVALAVEAAVRVRLVGRLQVLVRGGMVE
jgi:hypothetical protein